MEHKVRKAIIPAAGLGTRFLPFTKTVPKEMLPVMNKPAIQHIVEEAITSGIEEIMIVTAINKRSIEDHFHSNKELEFHLQARGNLEMLNLVRQTNSFANIHFIWQSAPAGLGDAILTARSFIGDEPFAVLLGDMIMDKSSTSCTSQLIRFYETQKAPVLAVAQVERSEIGNYGIVLGDPIRESVYRIHDLVEKPQTDIGSTMAIMGRYVLEPWIFDILGNTRPGAGAEIQLTDALKTLAQNQEVYAYQHQGKLHDIGNNLGYALAMVEWCLQDEKMREPLSKGIQNLLAELPLD